MAESQANPPSRSQEIQRNKKVEEFIQTWYNNRLSEIRDELDKSHVKKQVKSYVDPQDNTSHVKLNVFISDIRKMRNPLGATLSMMNLFEDVKKEYKGELKDITEVKDTMRPYHDQQKLDGSEVTRQWIFNFL